MLHYDSERGLSDLQETVLKTANRLQEHAGEFDSIAVQGTSGLLIGAPVAMLMDKPLVIVRESEEVQCIHSSEVENAQNAGQRVLFLDDQVSSGATLADVKQKLRRNTRASVVAVYLYQYDEYTQGDQHETVPSVSSMESLLEELLRGNGWS